MKTVALSIIIPLLNEEKNIEALYIQLKQTMQEINCSYKIIFVDDGSSDKSFEIIRKLKEQDNNVTGISLSRNFGHQIALMAGMESVDNEIVVTMDADLQHPPEVIKDLYAKYTEGYDIVNTRRLDSNEIGQFKKQSSKLFYKLINALSDVRVEPASSDFRLMGPKSVKAFIKMQEKDRFTRGMVQWMGFKQAVVEYFAPPRFAGKSKYTLNRMIKFALDGITSLSSKPLRLSFFTGFIIFLIGIIYAIFAVVNYFRGFTVEGWTSTMVAILVIGGFQLLSIGIIGEYIARIFNEAKARPLYFIKDVI